MKSLETLIKLQKTYVDEQRLMLAKLQEQLQFIDSKIVLLNELQEQQRVLLHKNPDMGMTYGNYLAQHIKKIETLKIQRKTMVAAVEMAREKLAQLFEEQKRYEVAQQQREEEEAQEEAARQTKILDEVGSVSFMRK